MKSSILAPRERKPVFGIMTLSLALAIVLLTGWAYAPALDAPFVLDDGRNIIDSPAIHWTEFSLENVGNVLESSLLRTRPLANLSFALDHLRVGLDPRGFHVTNILIHLAVGLALWWLCRVYAQVSVGAEPRIPSLRALPVLALVPVALFLLHPLNTQAVTYVVQRMTLLAALFTIVAFASYLVARYRRTSAPGRWYALAGIAWLLGLASKENAVLLVPVIVLYELCFFRDDWRSRSRTLLAKLRKPAWMLVTVVTVFLAVAVLMSLAPKVSSYFGLLAEFSGREFNGVERLMTQSRVQLFHLSQMVWPTPGRLNLDHDFVVSRGVLDPVTTLPAILVWVALLGSIFFLAKRYPRYGFPLAAYLVFHSLEAGPVHLEMVFEHRMYLPMSMMALLLTAVLIDLGYRYRQLAIAALVVSGFALAGWTNARNVVWSEPLGIHRDMALKSPDKARTQYAYALALLDADRALDALPVLRRAVGLDPAQYHLHRLLGNTLLELGKPDDAIDAFRTALALVPTDIRSMLGLGRALQAERGVEEAFGYYLSEGIRLGRGGSPWEAIPVLTAAVELRDDDAGARNALGGAYVGAGLSDKAIEQFRFAVQLDPAMYEAWFNLGVTAESSGYRDEAIAAYRSFLERAPSALQQPINRARDRIRALSSAAE
jgi:tetratricopeptide (TPR) repeat protein